MCIDLSVTFSNMHENSAIHSSFDTEMNETKDNVLHSNDKTSESERHRINNKKLAMEKDNKTEYFILNNHIKLNCVFL